MITSLGSTPVQGTPNLSAQDPRTPHRGNNPLTRDEMASIIREGRSVVVNHRIISRVEDLPNDEDVQRTLELRHDDILTGLESQIEQLQARKKRIMAQLGTPGPEPPNPGAGAAKPAVDVPEGALGQDFPAVAILYDAGFRNKAQVAAASDEELLKIKGIGEPTLVKIRQALKG